MCHNNVMQIIWYTVLHCTALYLFTSGFFLTRFEVTNQSSCNEVPSSTILLANGSSHLRSPRVVSPNMPWLSSTKEDDVNGHKSESTGYCWMKPRFQRIVFVIIDALRYDFVDSASNDAANYYSRRLEIVKKTLKEYPKQSKLFKFIADPPTMTMQRLKGLTTGNLPTFLDIKENLHSAEVHEDNILNQFLTDTSKEKKRDIIFMGDDTWEDLYKTKFTRRFAFDSFNVKDLDSVDNGVIRHLFPELKRYKEWDFLIAHFLGVDHVGHTYGPNTTFMSTKLQEMDHMLTRLIKELPGPDTLLAVLGDHGMSSDGNHGGASDDETHAALFMYSTKPFLHDFEDDVAYLREYGVNLDEVLQIWKDDKVPQVDLVPTVGLLLGTAVPFGNLGAIIPSMFYHDAEAKYKDPYAILSRFENLNNAYSLNVHQVRRYLFTYASVSKLTLSTYDHLENVYQEIESIKKKLIQLRKGAPTYGVEDVLPAIKLHARLSVESHNYIRQTFILGRRMWTQFCLVKMAWGIVILLVSLIIIFTSKHTKRSQRSSHLVFGCAFGLLVPFVTSLQKVTFLPSEPVAQAAVLSVLTGTVQYLWNSQPWRLLSSLSIKSLVRLNMMSTPSIATIWVHSMALLSNSYIVAEHRVMQFLASSLSMAIATGCLQRKFDYSIVISCVLLILGRLTSTMISPNIIYSTVSVWKTIMPTVAYGSTVTWCLVHQGNKSASSTSTCSIARFLTPLLLWTQLACMILFWLLSPSLVDFFRLWLPRAVFLAPFLYPTLVWSVPDLNKVSPYLGHRFQGTQILLPRSSLSFLSLLIPAYMLVLGPTSPIFLLLLIARSICYMSLYLSMREYLSDGLQINRMRAATTDDTQLTTITWAIGWCAITYHSYFVTGHENAFTSLQNASAFVGFDTYEFYRAGLLLGFNTFGIYVLQILGLYVFFFTKISDERRPDTGARVLLSNDGRLVTIKTVLNYFTFNTLVTAVFAACQRRHLMVWTIFAPKFIYDGLTSIFWHFLVLAISVKLHLRGREQRACIRAH